MNLKDFWNKSSDKISHLNMNNKDITFVIQLFEKYIGQYDDFNNKSITEYGVGGGYITNYILSNYKPSKYLCIDINDRCLEEVKKLGVDVSDVPEEFKECDIFICVATIQHFPSEEYLIKFLNKLNHSKIKKLYLQIRDGNKRFNGNLENESSMYQSCVIDGKFITEHLTNYRLIRLSETLKLNNYKYLTYERTR